MPGVYIAVRIKNAEILASEKLGKEVICDLFTLLIDKLILSSKEQTGIINLVK